MENITQIIERTEKEFFGKLEALTIWKSGKIYPEEMWRLQESFHSSIHSAISEFAEEAKKEIAGKKKFFEDEDHAVGGYISRKEINNIIDSLLDKK